MVFSLVKLELIRSGFGRKFSVKRLGLYLGVTFFSALMIVLMYFVSNTIRRLMLGNEFISIFILLTAITLLFSNISAFGKKVILSPDNDLFLKLPILKRELLLSKLIFIYLQSLFLAFAVLFCTVGLYGIVAHKDTAFFVNLTVFIVFLPIITMFAANLLAVPLMRVMIFFRRHITFSLILSVLILFLIFFAYSQIVGVIIYLISNSAGSYFNPAILESVKKGVEHLYVTNWIRSFILGTNYYFYIALALVSIGYFCFLYFRFARRYFSLLSMSVEVPLQQFKESVKPRPFAVSFLVKELKVMFRNSNALTVLLLPLVMPVIVTQTVRVVLESAVNTVGQLIYFPSLLLTFLFFSVIINSFAATALTRDGAAGHIVKMLPRSFAVQMLLKGLVHFVLVMVPTVISLFFVEGMPVIMFWYLLGYTTLFNIANILQAMCIDLSAPAISKQGGMVTADRNVMTAILEGFVIVLFILVTELILTYFVDYVIADTAAIILVVAYFLFQTLVFFRKVTRK